MHPKLTPSFGRRKARKLRVTSQQAYDDILPLVRLELSANQHLKEIPAQGRDDSLWNSELRIGAVQQIFPHNPSEVWLEIGFGGGEHMLEQLAQNPTISMIGCEPFMNGVANLLKHLSPEDYPRVRIWHEDVRLLLDHIPSAFFSRIFILFPDPWPKKRHQPRRLITSEFMEKLLPTLKPEGLLYVASDDASYVEQIQDTLYHHPLLELCQGPPSADPTQWDARPEVWPMTRYEQKAVTSGKNCAYMVFRKKEKT
jgi:tRNA (guanine-N7-)-methyltransferase